MKLRSHPAMFYRGVSNWPPVWVRARGLERETLRGEVGVLTFVHANPHASNKCFLVIEHQRHNYVGSLIFDSRDFCSQIAALLRGQIGRSIQEIGDLDVSHTL